MYFTGKEKKTLLRRFRDFFANLTMIELMIFVAIVGILAAIAIPAIDGKQSSLSVMAASTTVQEGRVYQLPDGTKAAVVQIEGCSYLYSRLNGGYSFLTHMGTCTNH